MMAGVAPIQVHTKAHRSPRCHAYTVWVEPLVTRCSPGSNQNQSAPRLAPFGPHGASYFGLKGAALVSSSSSSFPQRVAPPGLAPPPHLLCGESLVPGGGGAARRRLQDRRVLEAGGGEGGGGRGCGVAERLLRGPFSSPGALGGAATGVAVEQLVSRVSKD
ncbi:hypothetical protein NHX12_019574 [Muraenolepis orangiensis]|uniref:Uncharacterized protein n=1 Tax=Muraenolepis orangiensis TaxID=630683 RepID=A0A9Q0EU28_9TELE|nr:hypothetical protein NHX12_019574 [Muraenolepis orangiensis]